MFNIRQRYIDPLSNILTDKYITLTLEERRMINANSAVMEPYLLAYTNDAAGPDLVYLNADEYLMKLLDTKRTSSPRSCYQTYLTSIYDGGKVLTVFDASKIKAGSPVAILSDLNGTQIDYTIISSIDNDKLILSNELSNKYYIGAFVQNLSNRWWSYSLNKEFIGIVARNCRPSAINFLLKSLNGKIQLMIHDIPNPGTIKAYDVYVRKNIFTTLEHHWIADIPDNTLDINTLEINTFGGGNLAGGGNLVIGEEYYVAVVAKDKVGRVDVNESIFATNKVMIKAD